MKTIFDFAAWKLIQSETEWGPDGWLVEVLLYTSTETLGSLGMETQDIHLNFHTAPELWASGGVYVPCIYSYAKWELPLATQVFVVVFVWCLSRAD